MHATLTSSWQPVYVGAIAGTALLALGAIVVFIQPRLMIVLESARLISSAAVMAGIALTLHAGPWIQSPDGSLNTIASTCWSAAWWCFATQITVSVKALQRYSTR